MAKNVLVTGRKGGSSKPHTPQEMEDNLISINKIKVLLAISDGEIDGSFSLKDLYLNDVVVQNSDNTLNFKGVNAEFRPGTQTQDYIKGFTDTASETVINRALKNSTPFVFTVNNTNLSAVRVKILMPRGVFTEENGDMVGVSVIYAVDFAVDGGSYYQVFSDVINGKTMSGYDRSRRINLPAFNSQVLVRVRRVTADSTNARLVDEIQLQSYAEVIDAKFRYPLTGMLYVEYDSEQFPQVPNISVKKKWKIINVPSNYNADSREYIGSWDGTFKKSWTNNPAWILYDLITNQRYGLDQRELGVDVDKWALYDAARYCDQMVPDGKGGTEPRYLCDVVIQSQIEAYTLIRDICSIFRGMSFWNGESLSIVIDRPRDASYVFTNDNVVAGAFSYTFASEKSMYTTCNVAFDDEQNMYQQDIEGVFDLESSLRFGHNPTSITAIGCTRRSEANRRGRWILKTNLRSTTVNFATGLEGMIPMIGDVVAIADNYWSSNLQLSLSGRLMEVSGLQCFTYFKCDARPGDFIIVNRNDGSPVRRTIANVSADGKTIELNMGFGFDVPVNAVFAIDRQDLALQQYVVTQISRGDGDDEFTYSITAVEYDPNKYDAIDYGVNIDDRPTSIVDPDNMQPPENISVTSYSRVVQGMSVETMVIGWDKVQYASTYSVQWRKDNGNWNNIPITANTEVEVEGIYAGNYHVRVRSISSAQIASPWSNVVSVGLTGKVGEPNAPTVLTATNNEVFGIRLKWGMPPGSEDTAYVELQQSRSGTEENASLLTMVPYPQYEYWHSVLPAGYVNFYRARAVDRIGNVSAWTGFVRGMSSDDADLIGEVVKIDIENTEGFKELQENAIASNNKIHSGAETDIENALANDKDVRVQRVQNGKFKAEIKNSLQMIANESEARITALEQMRVDYDEKIAASSTHLTELIATETEARIKDIEDIKASIGDDIQAQITEVKEAIANETEARVSDVTALTARLGENESALNEKLDSWTDAESTGAMYSLKLGLKYNGVEYGAGLAFSLVGSGTNVKSQFLLDANRFAVTNGISGAGEEWALPFLVEEGQVIINSAIIKDGSITNAMIGNEIKSNNFSDANAQGWRLDKGGVMVNYGSTPGEGAMKQSNETISIRDRNAVLRVQIGRLTGVW